MRRVAMVTVLFAVACTGAPSSTEPTPVDPGGAVEAPPATPPTALAAGADVDDGLIDAAAYFNGGREVTLEGLGEANHANALFDRTPDRDWDCTIDYERCDVIVEFNAPVDLEKLVFSQSHNLDVAIKDLAIDVGPAFSGPWTEVAIVHPAKVAGRQSFPISAKSARFARLRPLAAHVQANGFYGFDDVELRGKRVDTGVVDWNGTWTTEGNAYLSLSQIGERVVGCVNDKDRLEGTVDGTIFSGVFHRIDGDTVTDQRLVIGITPERKLIGITSEDMAPGSPLIHRFDSTWNTEPVTVNCDPPKDEQPSEIELALAKDGRIALYGVLFDFDKATLKPESDKVLTALAAAITAKPERTYRIEGHTDNKGGDVYNQDLSERRAKAVEAWLVAHGCPDATLDSAGFGASSPVFPNETAAGRAGNRRVEVAIVEGTP